MNSEEHPYFPYESHRNYKLYFITCKDCAQGPWQQTVIIPDESGELKELCQSCGRIIVRENDKQ